jgi:probable H4MPT-linked C1 transfer pathway protein
VIPIRDGLPATEGKDDISRLIHGELVYSGALRTNVSAILRSVTMDGKTCRLSSEYFATSGDVHVVLGHVTEDLYTTETADGRGKTQRECLARLARVICGDIETVEEDLIVDIAQQAWEQQLDDIRNAIEQVCERMSVTPNSEAFVLAGLGAQFLGKEAVNRVGAKSIRNLEEVLGAEGSVAATAYSAALYAGINWRYFL